MSRRTPHSVLWVILAVAAVGSIASPASSQPPTRSSTSTARPRPIGGVIDVRDHSRDSLARPAVASGTAAGAGLREVRLRPGLLQALRPQLPILERLPGRGPDPPSLSLPFRIEPGGPRTAELEFTLPGPGELVVEARWSNPSASGRLVLRDPGGVASEASGLSALRLTRPAGAPGSRRWRASFEASDSSRAIEGSIRVWHPSFSAPPASDAGADASCPSSRKLLADGSVVVTYPDGREVTYLSGGGRLTRFPDGTVAQTMALTLPPLAPPPAPAEPLIGDWLAALDQSLLEDIQFRAQDDAVVRDYVQAEAQDAPTIYQRIVRRITTLTLLSGGR